MVHDRTVLITTAAEAQPVAEERSAAGGSVPIAIQALSAGAALATWIFVPVFADDLGASPRELGVLTGSFALANLTAFFIFGRASDIHGRRRFVQWGLALATLFFLALYLADDLVSLVLLRALGGFAAGIFPAALIAYVYERGGLLGRFAAYGSLGWGLGVLMAGVLVENYGVRSVFVYSGVLYGGAFVASLWLAPVEGRRIRLPLFPTAVIRRHATLFTALLIRHSGASAVWIFWALFLYEKGASPFWVGVILAANTTVQFGVMYFVSDRLPPRLAFRLGMLLTALSFAAFLAAPDYRYILAAQVILGTSWAFTYVGSLRLVTERAVEKATASGMLQATLGLAAIMGPIVGGVVVERTGDYETVLWVAMAAAVAALLLILAAERSGPPAG